MSDREVSDSGQGGKWGDLTYEQKMAAIDRWAEASTKADKGRASPIRSLRCTCCGESTRGRQWWNMDTGFGLCHREKCIALCTNGEIETSTYGTRGVHFDVEWRPAVQKAGEER